MPDKEHTRSVSESENPVIPAPTPKTEPAADEQGLVAESARPFGPPHALAPVQSDGRGLRLRGEVRVPRRRGAEARPRRADDEVAGLVAGRLRPLRPALHPHDVARRRHVPHRRRPRRRRRGPAALRSRSTAGPTTRTSTRRAGCSGRSRRSTARRSPGPTCSSSPATWRWSRWGSRRSASASAGPTSGSPRTSSGARRTPGSATSATAATATSPGRSAPCRWDSST